MRTPLLRAHARVVLLFASLAIACASRDSAVRSRAHVTSDERAGMGAEARAPFVREAGSLVARGPSFEARVDGRGELAFSPHRAGHAGAPLVLETTRISRDGIDARESSTEHAGLTDAGAVSTKRGEITEIFEATRGGVEEKWSIASRPHGDGDLVVDIATRGETSLGNTEGGAHARDPKSGLGVRYGNGTFVDESGARTEIAAIAKGDHIELRVPAGVVDHAKYPAVLDPTVTAEIAVDAPVEGLGAPNVQDSAAVASTPGGGYFAVWRDDRGSRPSIYGARVSSAGAVLDPSGIFIGLASDQANPAVASNGNGYFVSWAIQYDDQYANVGVYGVRVGTDGTVQDATPIAVATAPVYPQTPRVAGDGTNWLVVWSEYSGKNGYDVVGSLVGGAGQGAPPALTFSALPGNELYANVNWEPDAKQYLVSWTNQTGAVINGAHVNTAGAVTSSFATNIAASGPSMLSAAYNGAGEYFFTWYEYRTNATIIGARVASNGTALDAASFVVGPDTVYDYYPQATWDGTSFVDTWYSNAQIKVARVPTVGTITDPGLVIAPSGFSPAIASDGNTSLVVMGVGDTSTSDDVKMVRVKSGAALDASPVMLSTSSNAETSADVAFDGTNYYVVWLDSRGTNGTVYGARLDGTGKAIDAAPLAISTTTMQVGRPRVSFGGGTYFVVWEEQTATGPEINAARIGTGGTVQGSGLFAVFSANGDSDGDPAIGFDGTNFLVAWERYDSTTSLDGVQAIRVSPAGSVVDSLPFAISSLSPTEARVLPDIAFDGTNYLVVWEATQSTGSVQVTHIFGARVSPQKNVLDIETPICTAFLLQQSPRVASDGQTGFLVAWEDYRNDLNRADIYAARVGSDGVNVDGTDGLKISAGPDDESLPGVVFLGAGNYVVAWRDLRSQTSYDVFGAWVSLSGVVHDPTGFSLSAQSGDEQQPVLSVGKSTALLGYQRLDPGPTFGAWRVRTRTIDPGLGSGASCAADMDCASRYCTDGVCCGGDCGGCGTCNANPGTCTPLPAGEAPRCPLYNCDGTSTDCPTTCQTDADCTSAASCDTSSHTCVQRVVCTDDHTLKDLTGKITDCTPYQCQGSACLTTCGSADDCAAPFLCDPTGRCVPPPSLGDAGGCEVSGAKGEASGAICLIFAVICAIGVGFVRRRREAAI